MTTFRDIQTKDIHGMMDFILRTAEYPINLEDKQTGIELGAKQDRGSEEFNIKKKLEIIIFLVSFLASIGNY